MALLDAWPWIGLLWGLPVGFTVGAMAVGVLAHGRYRAMTQHVADMEQLIADSHALIADRCDTALIEEATRLLDKYLLERTETR